MGGGACTHYRIQYQPGPSQWRFHNSRAKFKAFSGPVGSGKTLALCQEALRLGFFNLGLMGVLGAPTYPMLRDVTRPCFLDILARAGIRHQFHRSENRVRLLDTDSQVLFRTLSDADRLRGPNLAWFAVDEATYAPWESWQQLQSRLRHQEAAALHGLAAFTPKGFDRYHEFFVARDAPVGERDLIRAVPFENAANLAAGFYETLAKSYDPLLYKQEALGEFLNVFAGQAYWAFERGQNVKPLEYDRHLPLWWSLDFNVDPMCSVIGQTLPGRAPALPGEPGRPMEIRVLDEIVLRTSSTYQAVEEFLGRYAGHPAGLVIYGDPAGNQRHSAATKSDWALVREMLERDDRGRAMRSQFRLLSHAPLMKERVQAVNAVLANAAGERLLFVSPKCRELIADLEQVAWKKGSQGLQLDKESDAERTHTSDALGYYIWTERPLRAAIGEKGHRLI